LQNNPLPWLITSRLYGKPSRFITGNTLLVNFTISAWQKIFMCTAT
jgi:hypothetical protein